MQKAVFPLLPAVLLVFILLGSGCTFGGGYADSTRSQKGDAIVQTARTQMGKPYKWGGDSPGEGFDCSGYVYWAYRQNGVSAPRNSSEQARAGREVGRKALRPGDIVIFSPRWQRSKHTGIYSGGGKFLHSPKKGSYIREDSIDAKHWIECFDSGRRLFD